MEKHTVQLYFKGTVLVEVEANPANDEAWIAALQQAWEDVEDDDLNEEAQLVGHDIISPEEKAQCQT